jgi:hypothetical protein
MVDVQAIRQLHRDMVVRWHQQEVDNPYDGLLSAVCQQFSFNFRLWHEEDIARSPDADDSRIAQVKRNIDRLNQQRNDWIEKIDDRLTEMLAAEGVQPQSAARLNTETPGSVIDRLSILALRIYHMEEQIQRSDATPQHVAACQEKLAVCLMQQDDLSTSLGELLDDLRAGRKRHRTYRQLKMYNDPSLNPYLYQAKQQAVGAGG